MIAIIMAVAPSLRSRHIDIGPDQRDRPQRKAADQRDPAGHRHGLRLRMAAGFCDMARQPACDAEHATAQATRMISTIQAKMSKPLMLAPQLADCGSGNFHLPFRISARGR